jgi:cyclase
LLSSRNVYPRRCLQLCSLLTLFVNAVICVADTSLTKERTITAVSSGAYVIRHKDAPNGIPNGNTEVIIGDREVLVVDSCYLASEARQDIGQIRKWTNKPVRYLVNTHWHNDHTWATERMPTHSRT